MRCGHHLSLAGLGPDRHRSGGHSMLPELTDGSMSLRISALKHSANGLIAGGMPQEKVDNYVLNYLSDVLDKDVPSYYQGTLTSCDPHLSHLPGALLLPVCDVTREDFGGANGTCPYAPISLDFNCDQLEPNYFLNDFFNDSLHKPSFPSLAQEATTDFLFKRPSDSQSQSSFPNSASALSTDKASIPKNHSKIKKFFPRRFSYSNFTSLPRYSLPSTAKTKKEGTLMPFEKSLILRSALRSGKSPLSRQQMNQFSHLLKLSQSLDFATVFRQSNDSNKFLYLRLDISIKTCNELILTVENANTLYGLYSTIRKCLEGLRKNRAMVRQIIRIKKEQKGTFTESISKYL